MQRRARDGAQPARAEAALAVDKRGANDAVIGPARRNGSLAGELGSDEPAARIRAQAQGRNVDEAHAPAGACGGERCSGKVMHPCVGLAAALAQDAHRVHHHLDALEKAAPVAGRGQALKMDLPSAARVARPDDQLVTPSEQCPRRVATDEAATPEHQHPHLRLSVISVLTELYDSASL